MPTITSPPATHVCSLKAYIRAGESLWFVSPGQIKIIQMQAASTPLGTKGQRGSRPGGLVLKTWWARTWNRVPLCANDRLTKPARSQASVPFKEGHKLDPWNSDASRFQSTPATGPTSAWTHCFSVAGLPCIVTGNYYFANFKTIRALKSTVL